MSPYRKAREKARLSRFEAAVKSGVSPGQIQNIEKGLNSPNVDTAKKLARAYGVTLDELTGFQPAA